MSTLPKGWVPTTVKDLAGTSGLFVDGDWVESKDQDPNGDIRLLQLADIGDGVFLDKSDRWINQEAFTRLRCTKLETGDVLIARMPDPLGRACLMPSLEQRCVTVVDVAALRVDPQVADNRWVMHTVNAPQLRAEISAQASGTTRKRISRGNLGGLQIPLPPESEQKRIADKLDTVLSRVDAVNTRLARVAPILKRFHQSVLAAATSGRLTDDWRDAHRTGDWTPRTVESLCLHISDGPFGSNLKSDDYTDEGARVVRLENIGHLSFDSAKETFISLDKYETLKKHTLLPNDLLFSSFVDEEVRVCEFPANIGEPTINKADCFCVRVDRAQVDPRFLAFRLACKSTYQALKALVHGATRPRINLRQLREFEVLLPSADEQAEIVRRVETLLAFADRLEARLQNAQTATERLTPALLAKAFRGELVPQDPNDEPASELLRLLQQAAPSTIARRGRKSAA